MERLFKRKIYTKLLEWKEQESNKTALLIEGARRVGKSTIVEEFARKEYESYLLIDFSIASKATKALFEDINNLDIFASSGIDKRNGKTALIMPKRITSDAKNQSMKHNHLES